MVTPSPSGLIGPEARGIVQRTLDAVLSLKCKATSLVVVLTLGVATVVSWYMLQSTEHFARNEQREHLLEMASVLAKASCRDYADPSTLKQFATDAVAGETLLYVVFTDDSGALLAAAERPQGNILRKLRSEVPAKALVPGQPILRKIDGETPIFLDVMYPVTERTNMEGSQSPTTPVVRGRLLGYVRTGIVADKWYRTMSNRLDFATGVAVLVIVAAIPLGFLLVRRIVAPIDELAGIMHEFSRGGLDVRSPVHRRDELGRLSLAFNRMADQHQQTHNRIVALNRDLEQRVADRTEQLRELASRDPLTGLYNRRYFNETLERRFSEATRYGSDLSCIMLDLDEFKSVNDGFGHHVGDDVLILLGQTIVSELRTSDVAARFGGDEFIVLLPQTDLERTHVLAERIVARFTAELAEQVPDARVTTSLGIASVLSLPEQRADLLLRAADRALYDAKARGKNRIAVAEPDRPAPV